MRGLAKELPASHQEIAAVAEAAGQLGIQTENVTAFTKTMIDMGESTNLSAETAATELARFANIVGMSQDKFSNLGSAIVDLGNNYATTESEISAMSLRLAGAGKQIGMSEGDILGFAAALSSVGIESQAGGTAFSKVMVQMQLATEKGVGAFDDLKESAKEQGVSWEELVLSVRDGGKALKGTAERMGTTSSELKKMYKLADKNKTSLESFSNVAGMTGDQFAKMFKSNPTEAIMKFVKGLSEAEKNGSSAIKVLDDMDIKEVRLRDSLLRAANASGIFGDAVKTGNSAFEENTALAEEAGKRYETVESQLGMLKNEVTDVAIEFGGPFLQALRDGVQTAKPFIKTMADLAQKFSEANPETQQAIIMAWNKLPINVKAMLGDNVNILSKVRDGTISIETYNRNVHPNLKILYGDESSLQNALKGASSGISSYNNNAIPSTKTMVGVDAASGPASNAFSSVLNFKNNLPDVISKTVRADFIGPVIPGRATGDPYFQGGPVWLGDGGKQEPFLTPQGNFGVSPSKWTMFNLPKGTKIWSSVQKLMDSLPRYANGTKFDDTGLSRLNFGNINKRENRSDVQSRQRQQPLVVIEKLIWSGKEDIRKTMNEIGWIVKTDERGGLA